MINSPCFKCEDRKVIGDYNCHSHCERYAEYRKTIEENKRKQSDIAICNYMINSVQKKRKKKNEKNRT